MGESMARPRIEIDHDAFRKLCALQCTLAEIASFFCCSEDTIERWCKRELHMPYAEAFKRYSADGKISLRRWQYRMAEKSVTMAIWLGKQWLGQKDVVDVAVSDDTDETVKEMEKYFASKKARNT
jgi:AraC-like DNA-binding protein